MVEQRGQVLDERCGRLPRCNANTAELQAVLEALAYASELPTVTAVQVCTDSKHIVDAMSFWLPAWIRSDWEAVGRRGGRSSKPIQNLDRWKRIAGLIEQVPRLRPVRWVKGHSGAQFNSQADRLARSAATEGGN